MYRHLSSYLCPLQSANLVSKYNFGMRVMAMAVASQLAFVGLSSGTVVALQPEVSRVLVCAAIRVTI